MPPTVFTLIIFGECILQKLKVLYVDDEQANLINFKIAFKKYYQIITASTGQEGLQLFQSDPRIAIVVADQRMPGMQGIDMLSRMREINPDAVRIVLTAYTEVVDLIDAINKGHIYHYVVKPWDESDLLQILKKAGESYALNRENKRLLEELKKKNKDLSDELAMRIEMERKLADQQAQLAHAGRLTAMGEMASGMAHEINQPLTAINMYADVCSIYFATHAPGVQEAEAAEEIKTQVTKIDRIISNMRVFCRKSAEELEPVNLSDPVEEALTFFREKFLIHSIRLDERIAHDLPLVRSDRQKYQQIVVNFLSNAYYAVEEMARIRPGFNKGIAVYLGLEEEGPSGRKIVFEVRDNGVGMGETVKERCLEPFFTTKEVGEGTGLGLSVSNGIARELGMRLEVESEEEKGAAFRIVVPLPAEDKE